MISSLDLAAPQSRVRRARIAVSIAFLLLGLGMGLWAVHIPLVQARLGIDPAVLGLALFTFAVGAVLSMPVSGWAIGRFGSRAPTGAIMVWFTLTMSLPLLAGSELLFFIAVFAFGTAMGSLDVAANVQASEIEAARGQPTMSSFHGFYAVGGLAGALLAAVIVERGWGDGTGAAIVAGLLSWSRSSRGATFCRASARSKAGRASPSPAAGSCGRGSSPSSALPAKARSRTGAPSSSRP